MGLSRTSQCPALAAMVRFWSDVFVLSVFLVDCQYLGFSNDQYFQGGYDEGSGRITLRRKRVPPRGRFCTHLKPMKVPEIQTVVTSPWVVPCTNTSPLQPSWKGPFQPASTVRIVKFGDLGASLLYLK